MGHKKNKNRWEPRSQDVYLRMLVKLYRFLARRTDSDFNKTVLKRLCMSNINRPPISVSQLSVQMRNKNEEQIAVIVGTVLNDPRLLDLPPMKVCALRFSDSAKAENSKELEVDVKAEVSKFKLNLYPYTINPHFC